MAPLGLMLRMHEARTCADLLGTISFAFPANLKFANKQIRFPEFIGIPTPDGGAQVKMDMAMLFLFFL